MVSFVVFFQISLTVLSKALKVGVGWERTENDGLCIFALRTREIILFSLRLSLR